MIGGTQKLQIIYGTAIKRGNNATISNRPKFGSVPVTTTILTETEFPVPVSDTFKSSVPAGILI